MVIDVDTNKDTCWVYAYWFQFKAIQLNIIQHISI